MEEVKDNEGSRESQEAVEKDVDMKDSEEKPQKCKVSSEDSVEGAQKVNGFDNDSSTDKKEGEEGGEPMEVSENNSDTVVESEEKSGSGLGNEEAGAKTHEDEPLPGWKRVVTSTDPPEVHFVTPTGEKMLSLDSVKSYCETHDINVDYCNFIFSDNKSGPERSNSGSPLPTNSQCASPLPVSAVVAVDSNSDSQNSNDFSSNSSKVPEKKAISTSALLRAYRPAKSTSTRMTRNQAANNQNSKTTTSSRSKNTAANSNDQTPYPSDIVPSLLLDCKTETLSFAQISKIQKLQEDLSKLQLLLWNETHEGDKNGGAPPLMNGTLGGSPGSQPLTNGTNLVGLQVPQFLLLQNGQMIGSSIPQSAQMLPKASSSVAASGGQSLSTNSSFNSKGSDGNSSVSTRQRSARINTSASNSGRSSPDIQVVKEMRKPSHVQGAPSTGSNASTSANSTTSRNTGTGKGFPLLNIVCRPKNNLPPSVAMAQRKELDAKVKSVLLKSAQEFVEWLLSEGLIRTSQFCSLHKLQPSQMPFKLKLGMFSDPKVLSTSGGYVWISECCGKKYVSVYSGSIFGSTPIDKVPPTAVLKLIYHWACQTAIMNVESWVKVDKAFINKIYNYLRCVCSVMLQDKVYDFGFDGTTVELGIVSLGTSTADGTKKAVKVEILGLYDRKMKSYRLFASEPEPGTSSRQRFIRILKPLERVVHTNAILLCDQSVDRNCLYNMNYGKVSVCETSDNEDNLQSNAKIMSYLRRYVPKIFQSTLSQLTLQQVQIVLDELGWRERFGHCAAQAYTSMTEHITYLTARESENPGVLHLLDFVAQKPQHNWRYKSQHVPKTWPALQPSIIMSTPSSGTISPQVIMDMPSTARSPLDHTNKVVLTPRNRGTAPRDITQPVPPKPVTTPSNQNIPPKIDAVELEPFYYGQIEGDSSLGREINNYSFSCHLCSDTFTTNIDFYAHLKGHIGHKNENHNYCCDYCTDHFETPEAKDYHQKFRHLQMDTRYTWCRICTESFPGEFQLVNHMAKKHYECELPYRCEVCNFTSSMYYSVISHFKVEHKGSPYVQCHYCLSVKTINSLSAYSFSLRMLQHLTKHNSQQGKCKSCVLTFYSKYLLDEHKKKDHVSRINVVGMQRYKIPEGHTRIMFRPWVKRGATSNAPTVHMQITNTVAISTTLQRLESLVVDVDEEKKYYCIECDGNLKLEHHFRAYQKCTKCTYSTCCRNMVSKHAQVFHPNGKSKSGCYRIAPPIIMPEPMYCICGFSTRSGNHLARHLALCEGGRLSAYPSMLDAMVYRGDPMTPSALALSTLGLSRMLPGSVTPAPSTPQETGEPSFDMTHFMTMSMDVDEEENGESKVAL